MRQSPGQPAKIMTSFSSSGCVFITRLIVDKYDIQIRVVAQFHAAQFAVGNNAKVWNLVRGADPIERAHGVCQCLT